MELKDYIKVVRTRIWLVVLPAILLTAAAAAFSLGQTPIYGGVAKIVLIRQDTGLSLLGLSELGGSQTAREDVKTQVEVIRSTQIAGRVKQALRLKSTVGSLLSRVTASTDTGTNVVTIQAVDPSPVRAAAIANSFAEQYIAWSRDAQRASINAAITDVEQRLADAQQRMITLESTGSAPDASTSDRVNLEVARNSYTTLADKLEELRIAGQLYTGKASLLATATANASPVSPSHKRNIALGLSAGLLLGIGLAFLAEQLDTRIKSTREVADICGAPVLATIPTLRVRKGKPLKLALAHRPDSPDAEAYRMLRNSLDFIGFDGDVKTLLVTSAVPHEGKSTIAANLAAVLSQADKKVMLIVCDFRLPAVDELFQIESKVGLADVLARSVDPWMAAQRSKQFDNLWILSAGPMPPNPSELLASTAMQRLLANLRDSVDWVILDSAPALATADAAAVARWVDGVIFVARVGTSRRDATSAGCQQLTTVGARILGAAVMGPTEDIGAYGYYGGYRTSDRDVS